jgi:hypothetical protein
VTHSFGCLTHSSVKQPLRLFRKMRPLSDAAPACKLCVPVYLLSWAPSRGLDPPPKKKACENAIRVPSASVTARKCCAASVTGLARTFVSPGSDGLYRLRRLVGSPFGPHPKNCRANDPVPKKKKMETKRGTLTSPHHFTTKRLLASVSRCHFCLGPIPKDWRAPSPAL